MFKPMIILAMKKLHTDFAERLAEICLDRGLKPHGRQAGLVRMMKTHGLQVTQPGVKKWFDGEAIPDTDKCIELAIWSGVQFEWLMTGRGRKYIYGEQPSDTISSVAEKMAVMSPQQQYQIMQLVDIIAHPVPPAIDTATTAATTSAPVTAAPPAVEKPMLKRPASAVSGGPPRTHTKPHTHKKTA
jgi:hypothetical protein